MIYGNKLKKLREEKNISQKDIANILGIERGLYSQYETEYFLMPIKHLNVISNYFEISIDYLFGLTTYNDYFNYEKELNRDIISKRLKKWRKELKITQDKLANILNVSQATIAKYERGINIIATPFLYTICKKYNISADYLLGKIAENKLIKNKE